ncbi:hypothetical protein HDU96_011052 [Phlyctochytrium bullatum]|nr:hypothetical protein HDU96_011052 [Phlyctochytrium bullatum]
MAMECKWIVADLLESADGSSTAANGQQNPLAPTSDPTNSRYVLCGLVFTDPAAFYSHLGEDHVGRRRTHNLTLTCRWLGCPHGPIPFGKRDHIWPHDLKKHMKNAHGIDISAEKTAEPGEGETAEAASSAVKEEEGSTPAAATASPNLGVPSSSSSTVNAGNITVTTAQRSPKSPMIGKVRGSGGVKKQQKMAVKISSPAMGYPTPSSVASPSSATTPTSAPAAIGPPSGLPPPSDPATGTPHPSSAAAAAIAPQLFTPTITMTPPSPSFASPQILMPMTPSLASFAASYGVINSGPSSAPHGHRRSISAGNPAAFAPRSFPTPGPGTVPPTPTLGDFGMSQNPLLASLLMSPPIPQDYNGVGSPSIGFAPTSANGEQLVPLMVTHLGAGAGGQSMPPPPQPLQHPAVARLQEQQNGAASAGSPVILLSPQVSGLNVNSPHLGTPPMSSSPFMPGTPPSFHILPQHSLSAGSPMLHQQHHGGLPIASTAAEVSAFDRAMASALATDLLDPSTPASLAAPSPYIASPLPPSTPFMAVPGVPGTPLPNIDLLTLASPNPDRLGGADAGLFTAMMLGGPGMGVGGPSAALAPPTSMPSTHFPGDPGGGLDLSLGMGMDLGLDAAGAGAWAMDPLAMGMGMGLDTLEGIIVGAAAPLPLDVGVLDFNDDGGATGGGAGDAAPAASVGGLVGASAPPGSGAMMTLEAMKEQLEMKRREVAMQLEDRRRVEGLGG